MGKVIEIGVHVFIGECLTANADKCAGKTLIATFCKVFVCQLTVFHIATRRVPHFSPGE
jgi:hypothetical protein